ncbi:MAG: serine protease [Clostridia bacterium]|nr:serine protease [Clostridia bacterium]MDE6605506.1 serine protease [Clostridia bacterium]MDE7209779.1 serine protease [Clostridia bacterium]
MKKKRGFAIALVIVSVVLALSLTACSGWFSNNSDPSRYFIDIGTVDDARTASIVANNTIASCVRIITEYKNGSSIVSTSASSGFVITEDGYVLTNRHCVIRYSTTGSDTPMFASDKPMSANYSVVFADNKEYSASLVAYSSSADLAVLKINSLNLPLISSGVKFQALVFETEEDLYYGQRVFTIGNPENIGLILTELTIASPAMRLNKNDAHDTVILDGNINHGNSGGPLFNSYSRICGIVYARIEGANKDTYGIGCAISTDVIIDFLDSIKNADINYKTTPATTGSGDVA